MRRTADVRPPFAPDLFPVARRRNRNKRCLCVHCLDWQFATTPLYSGFRQNDGDGNAFKLDEERAEDQRHDRHQLQQNVDSWSRGVFEWVANCIPSDRRRVRI